MWIEASYNPIFDATGRPFQVVKYATDVTAQVTLLSDLRHLIDRNFSEIDAAVFARSGKLARPHRLPALEEMVFRRWLPPIEEMSVTISGIAQDMSAAKASTGSSAGPG